MSHKGSFHSGTLNFVDYRGLGHKETFFVCENLQHYLPTAPFNSSRRCLHVDSKSLTSIISEKWG